MTESVLGGLAVVVSVDPDHAGDSGGTGGCGDLEAVESGVWAVQKRLHDRCGVLGSGVRVEKERNLPIVGRVVAGHANVSSTQWFFHSMLAAGSR